MRGLHVRLLVLGVSLTLAACSGDDGTGSTGSGTETTSSSTGGSSSSGGTAGTGSGGSGGSSSSSGSGSSTSGTGGTTGTSGATDSAGSTGAGSTGGLTDTFVTLETSMGDIVLQLDDQAAPITTANFLAYVNAGFYDGDDGLGATVFHRVISDFMIQGGGLTENLQTKSTMPPIVNESGNGLTNVRGSIAMARTQDPDSATSQFFINHVDNLFLDQAPGYAVFGEVVQGLDVVDAIAAVQTTTMSPYDDVPVTPIIITDAYEGVP